MIILILISIVFVLSILLFFVVKFIMKNKAQTDIITTLKAYGKVKSVRKVYDYLVDTNNEVYLVKIVYNFNRQEISVNSKNYWQLNDKVVSSKKSGKKIEGIYDLINDDSFSFNKPHKKVYIVYPTSKVLVKAINESELAFITPNTLCYGVNIVKFDEIKEIFKK